MFGNVFGSWGTKQPSTPISETSETLSSPGYNNDWDFMSNFAANPSKSSHQGFNNINIVGETGMEQAMVHTSESKLMVPACSVGPITFPNPKTPKNRTGGKNIFESEGESSPLSLPSSCNSDRVSSSKVTTSKKYSNKTAKSIGSLSKNSAYITLTHNMSLLASKNSENHLELLSELSQSRKVITELQREVETLKQEIATQRQQHQNDTTSNETKLVTIGNQNEQVLYSLQNAQNYRQEEMKFIKILLASTLSVTLITLFSQIYLHIKQK